MTHSLVFTGLGKHYFPRVSFIAMRISTTTAGTTEFPSPFKRWARCLIPVATLGVSRSSSGHWQNAPPPSNLSGIPSATRGVPTSHPSPQGKVEESVSIFLPTPQPISASAGVNQLACRKVQRPSRVLCRPLYSPRQARAATSGNLPTTRPARIRELAGILLSAVVS